MISKNKIDQLKFIYDEDIKCQDFFIKKILQRLKENKIYEDALIILTADHGEAFGERGFVFHGNLQYNELIHVPLIIKFPGNDYANKVVKQNVRLVDIFPTVLDALNYKSNEKLRGVSLIPAINGRNLSLPVYSVGRGNCLIVGKWKIFVKDKGGEKGYELYNLKSDPLERKDLSGKRKRVLTKMKERLKSFKKSFKERKAKNITLPKNIKEHLKKLGYL